MSAGEIDEFNEETIKIRGLRQRADLNGCYAAVIDMPPRASNGRIGVCVCTTGERVWIKKENTTPVQTEWIEGEQPYSPRYRTEKRYKSLDGARRGDPDAVWFVAPCSDQKLYEVWIPRQPAAAPTMGIGEGTDDDPFAGLKQHMEADGLDTSRCVTFSLKPGARGTGATLEECLANAQASTGPRE